MTHFVGIQEIDRQHEEILALIDDMASAAARGSDWYTRYEQVAHLREFCTIHFRVEEALMRVHDFPSLEAHAALHREFEVLLDQLAVRAVSRPLGVGGAEFLAHWWEEHITGIDRAYVDWFSRVDPGNLPRRGRTDPGLRARAALPVPRINEVL